MNKKATSEFSAKAWATPTWPMSIKHYYHNSNFDLLSQQVS